MASLTLTCPHCHQPIPLPAKLVQTNVAESTALVQIDREAARAHLEACRTKAVVATPTPPAAELAGRIHRVLVTGAFIATGGSRACVLCGCKGTDCMDGLKANGAPCCSGCGNGDTHPVPKGTLSCAEWAAEHHKADQ